MAEQPTVAYTSLQARSQHFYKGGHDDGRTEGPERGAEARSARGAEGSGVWAPSMGVWGRSPQKISEKSTLKLVLATSGM